MAKEEEKIAAIDKRYKDLQRVSRLLDSEITRNNPQKMTVVTNKVTRVNLDRIAKLNVAVRGKLDGFGRKKPSLATTSIDLSSRNVERLASLHHTPAARLRSSVDPANIRLDQILFRS